MALLEIVYGLCELIALAIAALGRAVRWLYFNLRGYVYIPGLFYETRGYYIPRKVAASLQEQRAHALKVIGDTVQKIALKEARGEHTQACYLHGTLRVAIRAFEDAAACEAAAQGLRFEVVEACCRHYFDFRV